MRQHNGQKDHRELPEIAGHAVVTDKRRISNIPMPNKRIIQAGSAEDIEIDMANILHAKRSTDVGTGGRAGHNLAPINEAAANHNYRTSNRAENSGSESDDGDEYDINGRP